MRYKLGLIDLLKTRTKNVIAVKLKFVRHTTMTRFRHTAFAFIQFATLRATGSVLKMRSSSTLKKPYADKAFENESVNPWVLVNFSWDVVI